jgi:hypothetical protein
MGWRVPAVVAAAALAVGLVSGATADVRPGRPPVMRGPYTVLETEFHAHTRFSDGFLGPFDLVVHAERRGLHALAVTEHNIVFSGKMARWFSALIGGPIVVTGQEVTSDRFHLHAIGTESYVHWDQSVGDVIADIHAQGGAAVAAHPVESYWEVYAGHLGELDGTEVMHPIAYSSRRGGEGDSEWRWEGLRDFYLNARAAGHDLAAIAASDYHFGSPLGLCRTLVFVEEASAAGIVAAVRARRTVVYDLDGVAYGDAELIALLEAEPYEWLDLDDNYEGSGAWDRAGRTLGWLGLVGLLVFRRRTVG